MESAVILPPDYVPSPDEEYMNDLQVEYFRQKLLAWKKSLLNQSQDTLEDLRQGGLTSRTTSTALPWKPTRLLTCAPKTAPAS